MVGIARCDVAPIAPCVEIGWRLARSHWGHGYATEAARAWLAHGFETLGLPEIVAFTDPANHRSLAVMRRLGMRPDPSRDFEHPAMPPGHPLRPHRLFALTRAEWTRAPHDRLGTANSMPGPASPDGAG
jgi:RimJ/RimL family protein N-acetyltransferase